MKAKISGEASEREGGSFSERAAAHFGMAGRSEFIAATVLFVIMVVAKVAYMFRYRFDSDESQHLHVVWGWANGLVQYRDVFDNHMPLFQLLNAPIFSLVGERVQALLIMRFVLLPFYFVGAWCVYRIGSALFSRRVGLWAVILGGCYTGYFFCSFEYRTDNLWAPLWLIVVLLLVTGKMTPLRAFGAGLLLGACFGISMKTSLLLGVLLVAAVAAFFLTRRSLPQLSMSRLAKCGAAFLAGVPLIPGGIMLAFAKAGLWPQMRYGVFEHNLLKGVDAANHPAAWMLVFPVALPFILWGASRISRAAPDARTGLFRAFLFLVCGLYLSALYGFWTLITRQDYLPFHPLAFILYSAALVALSERWSAAGILSNGILRLFPVPVWAAAIEFVLVLASRPFSINGAQRETDLLRDVLRLTDRGDYIIDCKGETIFRRRPVYLVMEPFALVRIQRHLVPDDVEARCVATSTCVAVNDLGRMPAAGLKFLRKNYLPVAGDLRVVGELLKPDQAGGSTITFDVIIPAPYQIISREGAVAGLLDGQRYTGARKLEPGHHVFVETSQAHTLALLWAQAVDRGFTPFASKLKQPPASLKAMPAS